MLKKTKIIVGTLTGLTIIGVAVPVIGIEVIKLQNQNNKSNLNAQKFSFDGNIFNSKNELLDYAKSKAQINNYTDLKREKWSIELNNKTLYFNNVNELFDYVNKDIKVYDCLVSSDIKEYLLDNSSIPSSDLGKFHFNNKNYQPNDNKNEIVQKIYRGNNNSFFTNEEDAKMSYFQIHDVYYFDGIYFRTKQDLKVYLNNVYDFKSKIENMYVLKKPTLNNSDEDQIYSRPFSEFNNKSNEDKTDNDKKKENETKKYLSSFIDSNKLSYLEFQDKNGHYNYVPKEKIKENYANIINLADDAFDYITINSNQGKSNYVFDTTLEDEANLYGPFYVHSTEIINELKNPTAWKPIDSLDHKIIDNQKFVNGFSALINFLVNETPIINNKNEMPFNFTDKKLNQKSIIYFNHFKHKYIKVFNKVLETHKTLLKTKRYNSFYKLPILFIKTIEELINNNSTNLIDYSFIQETKLYYQEITKYYDKCFQFFVPKVFLENDKNEIFSFEKLFQFNSNKFDLNLDIESLIDQIKIRNFNNLEIVIDFLGKIIPLIKTTVNIFSSNKLSDFSWLLDSRYDKISSNIMEGLEAILSLLNKTNFNSYVKTYKDYINKGIFINQNISDEELTNNFLNQNILTLCGLYEAQERLNNDLAKINLNDELDSIFDVINDKKSFLNIDSVFNETNAISLTKLLKHIYDLNHHKIDINIAATLKNFLLVSECSNNKIDLNNQSLYDFFKKPENLFVDEQGNFKNSIDIDKINEKLKLFFKKYINKNNKIEIPKYLEKLLIIYGGMNIILHGIDFLIEPIEKIVNYVIKNQLISDDKIEIFKKNLNNALETAKEILKKFGNFLSVGQKIIYLIDNINNFANNVLDATGNLFSNEGSLFSMANLINIFGILISPIYSRTKFTYCFKTKDVEYYWDGGYKSSYLFGIIKGKSQTINDMKCIDPIRITSPHITTEYLYDKFYDDEAEVKMAELLDIVNNKDNKNNNENKFKLDKFKTVFSFQPLPSSSTYKSNEAFDTVNDLQKNVLNNISNYAIPNIYSYGSGYTPDINLAKDKKIKEIINNIKPVKIVPKVILKENSNYPNDELNLNYIYKLPEKSWTPTDGFKENKENNQYIINDPNRNENSHFIPGNLTDEKIFNSIKNEFLNSFDVESKKILKNDLYRYNKFSEFSNSIENVNLYEAAFPDGQSQFYLNKEDALSWLLYKYKFTAYDLKIQKVIITYQNKEFLSLDEYYNWVLLNAKKVK